MTSPLRNTPATDIVHSWPNQQTATIGSASSFELDIIAGPPAFEIAFVVRLDRLKKRKCRTCEKRRIVYALRGYAGTVIISSSAMLCARCAGLVR
jgi:hypothetical protein